MRRENEFRYSKLANILREQILSGFIKPGDYLLSENELCKHYGLSRTSVRKSLDELVKEGLIVKKAGQGTIVSVDLVIEKAQRKILRILAPSPSHFVDHGLSVIMDAFQREFPQVEIKLLSLPTINYWESVRATSEMGLRPDIVIVSDTQYDEMDNLASFEDLLPSLNSTNLIYPKVINAFRYENQIKAAPVTFSTVYFAYNPVLFESNGIPKPDHNWTQADFIQAAQQLTKDTNGDGILDVYGFSISSHIGRWPVFALQNGIKTNLSSSQNETIRKTLTFIHNLLYRTRSAVVNQSNPNQIHSNPFIYGKAGMTLTTTFEMSAWKNEDMGFEPQVAPLPLGDVNATLLLANAFMIPSTCDDIELSRAFIKIALRADVQNEMSRATQFLSVLHHVNEEIRSKQVLDELNISKELMENNYFLHDVFNDPGILEDLEVEMEMFWLGLESADSLASEWERILSKQ
jgi:multiple sugar transport system substrate-binding protein